ncbi:MAG TPA: hypothetical protein VFV02_01765 [Acidimicrobiales bacterium]|nr:hypothetical protein [Acidimicrobiales bacterium]
MRTVHRRLAFTATSLAALGAVIVPAATSASASGAMVTQIATTTLPSDGTVIDVGTINSQFSSITIDASGSTTWCNNNPNPACTSTPAGADNYSFTLGSGAPLPGVTVGTLIAKVGVNGQWFVVGDHDTVTSTSVADVYVTYDDDVYWDNSGSYNLTITRVKPAS